MSDARELDQDLYERDHCKHSYVLRPVVWESEREYAVRVGDEQLVWVCKICSSPGYAIPRDLAEVLEREGGLV